MNPIDIIILAAVGLGVFAAIRRWRRSQKQGGCSCGTATCPYAQNGSCPSCGSCSQQTPKGGTPTRIKQR